MATQVPKPIKIRRTVHRGDGPREKNVPFSQEVSTWIIGAIQTAALSIPPPPAVADFGSSFTDQQQQQQQQQQQHPIVAPLLSRVRAILHETDSSRHVVPPSCLRPTSYVRSALISENASLSDLAMSASSDIGTALSERTLAGRRLLESLSYLSEAKLKAQREATGLALDEAKRRRDPKTGGKPHACVKEKVDKIIKLGAFVESVGPGGANAKTREERKKGDKIPIRVGAGLGTAEDGEGETDKKLVTENRRGSLNDMMRMCKRANDWETSAFPTAKAKDSQRKRRREGL